MTAPLSDRFPEKLEELTELLGAYECRPRHFLADTVLHGYCFDVLEHATAVGVLKQERWPRAGYSNARSALEAAQEALFLVADPSRYDLNGALARAWEALELEKLGKGYRAGRTELGLPPADDLIPAEDRILSDAAFCERQSPGSGKVLRQALETVLAEKARQSHWSGLTRPERLDLAERGLGLARGFVSMQSDAYSRLSIHAHSRVRLGTRLVERGPDNTWVFGPRPVDSIGPVVFVVLACMAASVAIRHRPPSADRPTGASVDGAA